MSAGTRIGPYEVTAPLGAGGMGEVYRARDTRLNRTVAIKALHAWVAADRDRVARFEREAQLLASLHHPNIAGIHGLETADAQAYLVLEFVDGKPLDAVLRETGAMAAPTQSRSRARSRTRSLRPERHHPSRPETRERDGDRRRWSRLAKVSRFTVQPRYRQRKTGGIE